MGGELVRPGSWWYFVAVVLLVIAGFLCFLAITAPVRGPGDLAPVNGTVAALFRDEDGHLVITLAGQGPTLRILENDLPFLDEPAFRREVQPGSPVTAQVITARLRDGSSPLTVFGLAGQTGVYLSPEPLIASRQHGTHVVLPGIALALCVPGAGAIWLGGREVRWQQTLWRNPPSSIARYRVGTGLIRAIGGLATLVFGWFTFLAWLNGEPGVAACFIVFILLGLTLILGSGTIEVDAEALAVRGPLGRFRIAWAEVTEIVHDEGMQQLVFRGADKQLVIPGPSFWSGSHRLLFARFLSDEIARRAIPGRVSGAAIFAWSRGTHVRRRKGGAQMR